MDPENIKALLSINVEIWEINFFLWFSLSWDETHSDIFFCYFSRLFRDLTYPFDRYFSYLNLVFLFRVSFLPNWALTTLHSMQTNPQHQNSPKIENTTHNSTLGREGKMNFRVCTARAISRNWQALKNFTFSKEDSLFFEPAAASWKKKNVDVDSGWRKKQKRQARYLRWIY